MVHGHDDVENLVPPLHGFNQNKTELSKLAHYRKNYVIGTNEKQEIIHG